MKKIVYQKGEKIGGCVFVKDIFTPPSKHRRAIFICPFCGEEFESSITNVKHNKKKNKCEKCISKNRMKHGLSRSSVYKKWQNMVTRCYNPNTPYYKNYGGRGIAVCDEWKDDFEAFYDYVKSLPDFMKKGYTIDRINNNGNYELGNIRWADRKTQLKNRRINGNNTSGYVGVGFCKIMQKFVAQITINYKNCVIGYFPTIQEAVDARNSFIKGNKLDGYKIQKYINGPGRQTAAISPGLESQPPAFKPPF